MFIKKSIFMLVMCAMSVMTFAQNWDITYNLNGGVTNDYGWTSKADMLVGLNQDWNDFYNVPETATWYTWETLAVIMAAADPIVRIPTFTGITMWGVISTPKWQWLHDYIVATVAAQSLAIISEDEGANAFWRYNVSAFFVNGKRDYFPITADYAVAGQPEAFICAWKHAFVGPATYDGTKEIILPAPYKEGETFVGWYDNPACTGTPITSIPAGASGDKVFYAKFGEYIPSCKEVWDMPTVITTKTAGVVTFISGTTAYIQDVTAGLKVEFATAPAIARGEKITVSGTTAKEGAFAKLTGATLVEKTTATIPSAQPVDLAGLTAKMFEYVFVEAARITAYNGNDVTLSDGANTVTLTLATALNQTEFPINKKVNVKAVVTAENKLAGVVDDVVLAPAAQKDPFVYPAKGENDKYTLTNKWLYSVNMGNFSANRPGDIYMVRGMTAKDGKMYFCDRSNDGKRLLVIDGADGETMGTVELASDVFAATDPYRCQDIHKDGAGNILVSNMIVSSVGRFQIWKIDLATGKGTLVINDVLYSYPDFSGFHVRFDSFGVFGDVNNNAVIMAANSLVPFVFKWTITNGVAGAPEYICILDDWYDYYYYMEYAPRVFPVSEELFYFDGYGTFPTLYDKNGAVIDGFHNASEPINAFKGSYAGNNGLAKFQIGDEHFLIMTAGSSTKFTYCLFKFKDAYMNFSELEALWEFPDAGLGANSNIYRTGMPAVEVNEETGVATIYIYTGENGYGVYELKVHNSTGVDKTLKNQLSIFPNPAKDEIFIKSESQVEKVEVCSLTGALLLLESNFNGKISMSALPQGVYLLKVYTGKGLVVSKILKE